MKHIKIHALLSGICLLGVLTSNVQAQAPSTIAGDAILAHVTSGSGLLAATGYYLLLPSNSGGTYQLIGSGNISDSSGTYSYAGSNAVGTITFFDSIVGPGTDTLTLQPDLSGQFALIAGTNDQSGNVQLATGSAPASLANHSYYVNISAGRSPFASQGSAVFSAASSGSNYNIFPISGGILESSGTYSYQVTNASTGCFSMADSVSGNSTKYLAFTNTGGGVYLVTQPSGAYQTGSFTVGNLMPAMFFMGQVDLSSSVDWLEFPNGTNFGYYDLMDFGFPLFYHYDMGFEWFFDANNSAHGCYLYDFSSKTFFYTDPQNFPNLYDFTLNAWIYWFPKQGTTDRYTSNPRYFYNYATSQIITK
jgi:hypothetical protein